MKTCYTCKAEKELSEFRKCGKGRLRRTCKECEKVERAKGKRKHRGQNRHVVNLIKLLNGCGKCGYRSEYPRVFDFHHLDEDLKTGTVSRMQYDTSLDTVMQEISKCVCLCANCHRIAHSLEEAAYLEWVESVKSISIPAQISLP